MRDVVIDWINSWAISGYYTLIRRNNFIYTENLIEEKATSLIN